MTCTAAYSGVIAADTPSNLGAGVSYQAHSYNDLREWPTLFRKGARYVKIDPQYAPWLFCITQERTNHSDGRGCLLLNHDTLAIGRPGYNTTDDVLAFLTDPAHAPWFTDPDPAQRVFIALCFKGCGGLVGCPCDDSTDTANWLSLVDDLVSHANAAVTSHGLNVQFVLDGDGTIAECPNMDNGQRWRPWVSTFISSSSNPRKDGAFTSNNASLGWDRLAVLNEDTGAWPGAVKYDYGKFVNSTYAYQVWEPSDQAGILDNAGLYLSKGMLHPQGLRFAINIDPAQFETYAGSITGRAWDTATVNATAGAGAGACLPLLGVAPVPLSLQPVGQPMLMLQVWQQGGGCSPQEDGDAPAQYAYSISAFNSTGSPLTVIGSGDATSLVPSTLVQAASLPTPVLTLSVLPLVNGTVLAVATSTGGTGGGALSATAMLVSPSGDGRNASLVAGGRVTFPVPPSSSASAIAFATTSAAPNSLMDLGFAVAYAPAPGSDPSCALRLGLYTSGGKALLPGSILGACLVSEGPSPALGPIGNISVAGAVYTRGGSIDTWAGFAVVYTMPASASGSAGSTVFGASACVDLSSDAGVTINDPTCGVGPWSTFQPQTGGNGTTAPLALWSGSAPSVTVLAVPPAGGSGGGGGGMAVMVTHGEGYCANSEAHNKDANTGLCEQLPVVSSGARGAYMNYAYGSLGAWTQALLDTTLNVSTVSLPYAASPCSSLLASGMYGMGGHPSPVLWLQPVRPSSADGGVVHLPGTVRLAAVYEGSLTTDDPLSCGAAVPAPGAIKLAGWPLAQSFF